jgi:hypothetical protein
MRIDGLSFFEELYLLLRKMGIVVAPLHLEVCVVFGSPSSSSSSIDLLLDVLLDMVETFPPLRIRRRLVPMGPGKLNFPEGAGSAVVAMVKEVE